MNPRLLWFALLLALGLRFLPSARAQIEINIKLRRHSFIPYEPVEVILSITNYAGRDLVFENVGDKQWFEVEINSFDGNEERQLAATQPDYKLNPLHVPAGQTIRRQVDIGPHFALRQSGTYRLRASVYLAELDRYIPSNTAAFDLTEGRLLWRQTVGVPLGSESGAGMRTFSLISHIVGNKDLLYVRVRDDQAGVTYATDQLGRLLGSGEQPNVVIDRANRLHVLHLTAPRTYVYNEVDLDGASLARTVYVSESGRARPTLVRRADGSVEVRGGQVQIRTAQAVNGPGSGEAPGAPKLSDRPAGVPKPVR